MTEQEAITKWCPMSRTSSGGDENTTINRLSDSNNFTAEINCIASDCMMWRWESKYPENHKNGYCGLGGC